MNVGACVLPTSTTSGVSESLDSEVVSFSTSPSHSCCSMVSVEPGCWSSKVFFSQSRASCGVSVPLSQTRMSAFSGPPPPVEASALSSSPQADRPSPSASTPAVASAMFFLKVRTLVFLSIDVLMTGWCRRVVTQDTPS